MSGYDDILHLPHHQSAVRPHMSMADRAAQFSPYAALTGFGAVLTESARPTLQKPELDESAKTAIDRHLQQLISLLPQQPQVTFTWFRPDDKKTGGAVIDTVGIVRKYQADRRQLLLTDGTVIPLDDLLALSCREFTD